MLRRLFKAKPDGSKAPALRLYGAIVAAARQPEFYRDMAVPDTVDGRFDILVLHLSLIVARLKGEDEGLRQELVDAFCTDMDDNLREQGASDIGVAKKVRLMAEAFHGRYKAYEAAQDQAAMETALARNVYAGKDASPSALARYSLHARATLAAQPASEIIAGRPHFTS